MCIKCTCAVLISKVILPIIRGGEIEFIRYLTLIQILKRKNAKYKSFFPWVGEDAGVSVET